MVARVANGYFDGAGNQTCVLRVWISPVCTVCTPICKILHRLLLRIKGTFVSKFI